MARKLLLADDSITIQKVVELVLVEEDFEIKSVSNGEDALKIINSFRPDVVLADIEMPKVNGYQLCEKIKQNPSTARTPVILLAGAFEPIDEDLARKVGADDSVIKPFESQELISKINAALTMTAAGEEELAVAETAEEEEGEGAIEIMEEEEVSAQPAAAEMAGLEEDLWAMEEPSAAPEILASEEEVEAGLAEDVFALAEEEIQPAAAKMVAKPALRKDVGVQQSAVPVAVSMPSNEELLRIFEKAANDRLSSFMAALDIKDAMLTSMAPLMKDAIEKVLWEVAPELVEKMLKEALKGTVASLTKEVEKVLWETVPDLATTMITKEIEKIKSEF